jgi:hypothetical protein
MTDATTPTPPAGQQEGSDILSQLLKSSGLNLNDIGHNALASFLKPLLSHGGDASAPVTQANIQEAAQQAVQQAAPQDSQGSGLLGMIMHGITSLISGHENDPKTSGIVDDNHLQGLKTLKGALDENPGFGQKIMEIANDPNARAKVLSLLSMVGKSAKS